MNHVHGEARVETDPSSKVVLQSRASLCDSLMWQWLSKYYEKMAAEAWATNQVPMFVSSNARLCRDYATLVYQYMVDFYNAQEANKRETMYIVELGAGHGRFSFLFLRFLLKLRPLMEAQGFPTQPFVYIFTDIAQGNIDACREHPRMQQYIKDGWLDFALFDANSPPPKLHLIVKDQDIPKSAPFVVLSNYVMDSLKADAVQIVPKSFLVPNEPGVMLSAVRVSLYSSQEEPDPTDPEVLGRATFGWDWQPLDVRGTILEDLDKKIDRDDHKSQFVLGQGFGHDRCSGSCSDPNCQKGCLDSDTVDLMITGQMTDMSEITKLKERLINVEEYSPLPDWLQEPHMMEIMYQYSKQSLEMNSPLSITIPIGALSVFRWFIDYSNNQLMVLIGDKGYSSMTNLIGLRHPHIAIHGTISFGLNFNVLEKFTEVLNGFHFNTKYKVSFHVSCFCFPPDPKNRYVNLGAAMLTRWEDLAPETLVAIMQEAEEVEKKKGVSLRYMNAIIRLSCHDPDALTQFSKSLKVNCQPPEMTTLYEVDMLDDIAEVYANWFKLRSNEDLPETLAHMCVKMGKIREALFYFKEFVETCPSQVSAGTLTNIAGCLNSIKQFDEAEKYIQDCLKQYPDFQPALSLKTTIAMSRRIRKIAVIGCGNYSSDFCQFLTKHACLQVALIFSFNVDAAKSFKLVHQLDAAAVIEEGAWKKANCESAEITDVILDVDMSLWKHFLPPLWHAGKNVLCEKTIGISFPELHELIVEYTNINEERSAKGLTALTWHVSNRESSDLLISPKLISGCGEVILSASLGARTLSPKEIPASTNGREIALKRDLVRLINLASKLTNSQLRYISCQLSRNADGEAAALNGWVKMAQLSAESEYLSTFHVGIVNHGASGVYGTFLGKDGSVDLRSATCYWKITTRVKDQEIKRSYMSSPIQDSLTTFLSGVFAIETGETKYMSSASTEMLTRLMEDVNMCTGIEGSIQRGGLTVTFQKPDADAERLVTPDSTNLKATDSARMA